MIETTQNIDINRFLTVSNRFKQKTQKKFFDPKIDKGPPFALFLSSYFGQYLPNHTCDHQNFKRSEFSLSKYPKSISHSAYHPLPSSHIKYM